MHDVNDRGLVLEIEREELKKLLLARAENHSVRAAMQAKRMAKFEDLLRKSTEEGIGQADYRVVDPAASEDDEGNPIRTIDLSNSSVRDMQQHLAYARDRLRAHKTADGWLRFVAAHLPNQNTFTFSGSGIEFMSYLVDVNHPTAMPSGRLYERGVQ